MSSVPVEPIHITCPYGKKGSAWRAGYHTGTDYRAARHQSIYAVLPGRVVHVGRTGGWGQAYGLHVIIEDSKGRRWLYAHLSSAAVHERETVDKGRKIGAAGATGNAFGVHLHLECREAPYRYAVDTLDPAKVLAPKRKDPDTDAPK